MNILVSIKNVSKQFFRNRGDSNIFYPVNKADLTLHTGEIIVILGASGSGKTTLLNMISGILTPSEGEVKILGEDIYQMKDKYLSIFRNTNIGSIPQNQSPIYSLNVMENILLPFTMYNKDKSKVKDKMELASKLVQTLKIDDLKEIMPDELSGGELRRMAIARALIMEPSIIIADEPTSDLDDSNTEIVLNVLKDYANKGNGIIIVTHDEKMTEFADTVYRMQSGILKGDSINESK